MTMLMEMDARITLAIDLMTRFAKRTGLASDRAPRRYLWTDAFAVCNFLALDRATGERRYLELALRLVEQVHATLGRHRPDDARHGWISGLPGAEAEAHPTRGGLRIGKPLPERGPGEPSDERLEWDRDGQYFHYLTKWMHALDRVAHATQQPLFASWACELAVAAHHAFTQSGDPKRMFWKMSIDLSRPLVASMGHHDPLDGLVTCVELAATARTFGSPMNDALTPARADFTAMIDPDRLATTDPLGIGGLLVDASRLARVATDTTSSDLVDAMLVAAHAGLRHYVEQPDRRQRADRRLAFRELGLAIGLGAVETMQQHRPRERHAATDRLLANVARFVPLRTELETFWRDPANRDVDAWREHEDINDVMLATTMLPDAILG